MLLSTDSLEDCTHTCIHNHAQKYYATNWAFDVSRFKNGQNTRKHHLFGRFPKENIIVTVANHPESGVSTRTWVIPRTRLLAGRDSDVRSLSSSAGDRLSAEPRASSPHPTLPPRDILISPRTLHWIWLINCLLLPEITLADLNKVFLTAWNKHLQCTAS